MGLIFRFRGIAPPSAGIGDSISPIKSAANRWSQSVPKVPTAKSPPSAEPVTWFADSRDLQPSPESFQNGFDFSISGIARPNRPESATQSAQ
jgi:hypothetical protein